MRSFLAAVVAALTLSICATQTASASTFSTDITDMWYVPAESGWGINVILQNNVAFVTFFVYDVNRNPVWYTATLNSNDGLTWTGRYTQQRARGSAARFHPAA